MWSCRSIFIFCLPNPVGGIHPQMRGTGHPPCCNVSGNPKAGPSARHATKAPPISHPRRTGRQESVSPGKMHRAPRLWGQDLEEKIEGVNKMKPEKQSQWPSFKNMRTTGYPPLVSAKIKNLSHAATGMLDEDRLRQVDHLFAGVERIGFSFPYQGSGDGIGQCDRGLRSLSTLAVASRYHSFRVRQGGFDPL